MLSRRRRIPIHRLIAIGDPGTRANRLLHGDRVRPVLRLRLPRSSITRRRCSGRRIRPRHLRVQPGLKQRLIEIARIRNAIVRQRDGRDDNFLHVRHGEGVGFGIKPRVDKGEGGVGERDGEGVWRGGDEEVGGGEVGGRDEPGEGGEGGGGGCGCVVDGVGVAAPGGEVGGAGGGEGGEVGGYGVGAGGEGGRGGGGGGRRRSSAVATKMGCG